jgi:amylosucrase
MFMGEEWGVLNDYSFAEDPEKADDSRWVHRPEMDWGLLKEKRKKKSVPKNVYRNLQEIIRQRKQTEAFRGNHMKLVECENQHVLVYLRWHDANLVWVVANFSEDTQSISLKHLRSQGYAHFLKNKLSEEVFSTLEAVELGPYELLWLEED